MTAFTACLQAYFTTYLTGQKSASGHTIDAYRDTFRLLLRHLNAEYGIAPDAVEFTDLGVATLTGFLSHLETKRHNSTRTRNARLAAIHSFLHYAALDHPDHSDLIARGLAIQAKNASTPVLTYLTVDEVDALLNAPNRASRTGERDYVIMAVLIGTGLRVSELTGLTHQDLHLGKPAHLLCHGKGRKDRITPLNAATTDALTRWISHSPPHKPEDPIFTAQGSQRPISRDAIAARLTAHAATAAPSCASLAAKRITPHTLRHTTAMRMLEAGIDITTIALWLGHESTEATMTYLQADLTMKQKAMDRISPPDVRGRRYHPKADILNFLENL
jgi:site-specific recombinase XerD